MGPNNNAHCLGHPSPLHWLLWAFVGLCVPSLAHDSPALACIGLQVCWPALVVIGFCGLSLALLAYVGPNNDVLVISNKERSRKTYLCLQVVVVEVGEVVTNGGDVTAINFKLH